MKKNKMNKIIRDNKTAVFKGWLGYKQLLKTPFLEHWFRYGDDELLEIVEKRNALKDEVEKDLGLDIYVPHHSTRGAMMVNPDVRQRPEFRRIVAQNRLIFQHATTIIKSQISIFNQENKMMLDELKLFGLDVEKEVSYALCELVTENVDVMWEVDSDVDFNKL
tara:strand:- start:56 stop:547 length:492 start_codon:yes stop_codon:yes gene_type:complete